MPLPLSLLRGAALGPRVLNFAALTATDLRTRFGWTRTGAGTMQESDGDVVYGAHNLLLQSQNLAAASWNGTLGASSTASTVTIGAGIASEVRQFVSIATAGQTFTVQAKVSVAAGTKRFRLKNTHGGVVDNFSADFTATTTPTVFSFTVTNASAAGEGLQIFGFVNASDLSSNGETFTVTDVQLNFGPVALEYVPTTTSPVFLMRTPDYTHGVPGLLLEGARTQLFASPADLTNPVWSRTGVDLSPVLAPDGVAGAALVEDASSGFHRFFQTVPTTGAAHTIEFLAQAGARDYVYLRLIDSAGALQFAFFNLAAGAVVSVSAGLSGRTVAAESGWWRCIVTVAAALDGFNTVVFGASADGTSEAYSGATGATAIRVSVRNAEPGAYPTSYIPNPGTGTVTRAADVPGHAITGSELAALFPAGWGANTIILKYCKPYASDGNEALLALSAGASLATGNFARISCAPTGVFASGNGAAVATQPELTDGSLNRVAISWSGTNLLMSVNGGAVQSISNFDFTGAGTTHLILGALTTGGLNQIQAVKIAELRVLPGQYITGAALQALTV